MVEVQGLKSRGDLNGKLARVTGHDEVAGRVEVSFDPTRGFDGQFVYRIVIPLMLKRLGWLHRHSTSECAWIESTFFAAKSMIGESREGACGRNAKVGEGVDGRDEERIIAFEGISRDQGHEHLIRYWLKVCDQL